VLTTGYNISIRTIVLIVPSYSDKEKLVTRANVQRAIAPEKPTSKENRQRGIIADV
jgi:hypothetical protein